MRLLWFSASLLIASAFQGAVAYKDHDGDHGHHHDGFVKVHKTGFTRNGKEYKIRGANYWDGMNLASTQGGNRTRLNIELDQLKALGVNNLRIMGSSEGPNNKSAFFRMQPSLMISPGKYNEDVFVGLDYLLDQMAKRDMTAVVTLGNFWHWSGGFSTFIKWVTGTEPPYPSDSVPNSYNVFTEYTQAMYYNASIYKQVNKMFKDHITKVQTRRNTINGKLYSEDPSIMTWEIANEPQSAPKHWFDEIAAHIKKHSPKQLITSGIESKLDQKDFLNAHSSPDIDYATCHLWVENWGIYNASDPNGLPPAMKYATSYIKSRGEWASGIKKPIVLEEFGMARDAWKKPDDLAYKYLPSTTTEHKDKYYDHLLSLVKKNKIFPGSNFWSYGGVGRSTDKENSYGMVWLGDPPHEPRGWYSVYDKDTTMKVLRKYYK
ncbi:glycoside hydrolase [Chlamydoabsidia padenii]|nr:glycoside hydrolase [Chlamydoabsidia padenii]